MSKTHGNKAKLSVIALTLVACLMVAGVSAYFTDGDTQTNTFTVGKISMDLTEPNWDPEDVTEITPEGEYPKDPQVTNNGNNDEYVFVEVVIPYQNLKTAGTDGTVTGPAFVELFKTLKADGSEGINAGWTQLSRTASEQDETVTYVFAYGSETAMTVLAEDATTSAPVFSSVKFANIVEDQDLEESDLNIVVNAYGIQSDNLSVSAPSDIWSVVKTQAPTLNDK